MRGRLPGRLQRDDVSLLEYIFRLSLKYEIDSDKFFEKIVSALKYKESICGGIKISYRGRKDDNSHVFLFTKDDKVVAQFPILERILLETKPLRDLIDTESLRSHFTKNIVVDNPRIVDLKMGMRKISLKARILEIPESRLVHTRWGSNATVSNMLVGDETGTIRMPLWNAQIKKVVMGDVVQIENAYVSAFRGETQLRIGKRGIFNVIEEEGFLAKNKL
jgi:replication factor A1